MSDEQRSRDRYSGAIAATFVACVAGDGLDLVEGMLNDPDIDNGELAFSVALLFSSWLKADDLDPGYEMNAIIEQLAPELLADARD